MKLIKVALIFLMVYNLQAREQVNMSFSDLNIDDFVKLVSKITNKNILVNYKVAGKVDLITTTAIYDDEVMDILISVLESKGYTLIQNGSVYEVIRSVDAAQANLPIVKKGKNVSGSFMVTQSIVLERENVDVMASKVRHLISKSAKLVTMKESNTLLLTDYPENIETIKAIIRDLETENQNIVHVLPVKYAEIKQMHKEMVDISKSLFNEQVEDQKVKVLLNEHIRSLIIVAKQSVVDELLRVAASIDKEQDLSKVVKVYPLKNSDSKKVVATLNAIVAKQVYTDPSLKPNITESEEINSIIIVGEPSVVKGFEKIIEELDKEKYQVYVQARIIEISNKDTETIGLKYGLGAGSTTSSGIYAMSANFGESTLTGTASSGVLAYLGDIGSGAKSALALGAALDFLQSKGASKTVSTPSILCVNNQESSIEVGKVISIQSNSTITAAGTPSNSYTREDVGLTLKIKPRVSDEEKVTLDATAELENIESINPTTGQPTTTKQKVVTQTILRHGESIIIGGLVRNSERDDVSKVPLLGDIPLFGSIFTHDASSEDQSNLIILLTPYIINNSENLSKLQQELGELERLQSEYNKEVFKAVEKKADGGATSSDEDENVPKITGGIGE